MDVTGTGRTQAAIRAMLLPHAHELHRMAELSAKAETIAGGVRLTVTARKPEDERRWRGCADWASWAYWPWARTTDRIISRWRRAERSPVIATEDRRRRLCSRVRRVT
jgi:hypothetical protein